MEAMRLNNMLTLIASIGYMRDHSSSNDNVLNICSTMQRGSYTLESGTNVSESVGRMQEGNCGVRRVRIATAAQPDMRTLNHQLHHETCQCRLGHPPVYPDWRFMSQGW
jgi:hypothetical protein